MNGMAPRDERQTAIDNAADRLSYLVLAYGILAIVAIRGLAGEASWDLLALVVAGGGVGLAYRLRNRVVTRPWLVLVAGSIVAAGVLALIIASQLPR